MLVLEIYFSQKNVIKDVNFGFSNVDRQAFGGRPGRITAGYIGNELNASLAKASFSRCYCIEATPIVLDYGLLQLDIPENISINWEDFGRDLKA